MVYKLEMVEVVECSNNNFGDQIVTLVGDYICEETKGTIVKHFHVVNHEGEHQPLVDIVKIVPKTLNK